MAKAIRVPTTPKQAVSVVGIGAAILLLQHFLAAEGESWLKKLGLWPRG
jgi:hypothetical protein